MKKAEYQKELFEKKRVLELRAKTIEIMRDKSVVDDYKRKFIWVKRICEQNKLSGDLMNPAVVSARV
jgi:hypothetical protein